MKKIIIICIVLVLIVTCVFFARTYFNQEKIKERESVATSTVPSVIEIKTPVKVEVKKTEVAPTVPTIEKIPEPPALPE